jgi:AGCS family alanine or glycine:cation symporter
MNDFAAKIDWLATAMYWPWTVCILLAMGIFFTIRTRFVQVRRFREALSTMVATQQSGSGGALSPFQAFMTGLAATIGTGNIAGVATAIIQGGPGALFWIWVYGFLATAAKFAEAVLGLKYRVTDGDVTLAGPMYYLRDGLKSPALAWIYALVAGVACLFTTPFTQPNSIAVAVDSQLKNHGLDLGAWSSSAATKPENALELNRLAIGVVLAILTWLVVIGGVKSIGRAAEKLSPLKVGLYLIGGLIVIATHITALPEVLKLVFEQAFSTEACLGTAEGGAVWLALRYGLARGSYANEAGFGTAAVVYGVAKSNRPDQQGLNAVMEVFIITFITSTISALTILLTGAWKSGAQSSAAVAEAFNASMPVIGGWMLTISIFLFGYTTLMGWAFYGEQFLEYLFGRRIVMPYRWLYCLLIPLGAVAKVDLVWAWGDILNGSQVFPNLIGIIALSGVVVPYALKRKQEDGDRDNAVS